MEQEDREAIDKFAFLGLPHALDFLGDRRQIGLSDTPGAQERRLFETPGVEIVVVQRSSRRHGYKPTPDLRNCRLYSPLQVSACARSKRHTSSNPMSRFIPAKE